MAGHKAFATLTAGFSPDRRAKIAAAEKRLRAEMSLTELRQARHLTQEAIGDTLHVGQPAIAKIEKRTDMYVGNLRRFVEAMGGELEIVARFPEGEVKINNFADLDEAVGASTEKQEFAGAK